MEPLDRTLQADIHFGTIYCTPTTTCILMYTNVTQESENTEASLSTEDNTLVRGGVVG